tara:strand:- start:151 stop:321 length:171 start_codon:yes stop_codon:yes gene_type:complete
MQSASNVLKIKKDSATELLKFQKQLKTIFFFLTFEDGHIHFEVFSQQYRVFYVVYS